MKRVVAALCILLFTVSAHARTFIVERVIDGETLLLANGESVKLIGVDAPPVFDGITDFTLYDPSDEERAELQRWNVDIFSLSKNGEEARKFLKREISNKKVNLVFDEEKSRDDQLFAYVFVNISGTSCRFLEVDVPIEYYFIDGEDDKCNLFINAVILKAGYAQPLNMPRDAKYGDLFQKFYEEAKEKKRGLWADERMDEELFLKKINSRPKTIAIPMH